MGWKGRLSGDNWRAREKEGFEGNEGDGTIDDEGTELVNDVFDVWCRLYEKIGNEKGKGFKWFQFLHVFGILLSII